MLLIGALVLALLLAALLCYVRRRAVLPALANVVFAGYFVAPTRSITRAPQFAPVERRVLPRPRIRYAAESDSDGDRHTDHSGAASADASGDEAAAAQRSALGFATAPVFYQDRAHRRRR
jgi:hypothetical protein